MSFATMYAIAAQEASEYECRKAKIKRMKRERLKIKDTKMMKLHELVKEVGLDAKFECRETCHNSPWHELSRDKIRGMSLGRLEDELLSGRIRVAPLRCKFYYYYDSEGDRQYSTVWKTGRSESFIAIEIPDD